MPAAEPSSGAGPGGADGSKPSVGYTLRISRLTIDKLGVKLYDKVSAAVAELIANGYDADAREVVVELPLGTELATKDKSTKQPDDKGYEIVVTDDGHGMTPDEARAFYLQVGRDRRAHEDQGARSRGKQRPVMGRKGIGKLAPFGICRVIEVLSAGGEKVEGKGHLVTHFFLDFDQIVQDTDAPVPLKVGDRDETYSGASGTTIRLTMFLPKRVPTADTFHRQVATRFALAAPDFTIKIKPPRHQFASADYERLQNYVDAFTEFFASHASMVEAFPDGWVIDLVADGVSLTNSTQKHAFQAFEANRSVVRRTWNDFLASATTAHEEFLEAYDKAHSEDAGQPA